MRLLFNQTPPPLPEYFRCNWAGFVSNIYTHYLWRCSANVRRRYSHSKYIFSSSFAVAGISLFPIKGGEKGKSGLTTIRAWVKYLIVEIFRQIGWGSNNINVLPEGTLVVNLIISWTYSNNKKCADTLIDDGAQLILAHNCSIMPGSSAITRILTNSHIFACSAHIAMIFTYMETPPSPLSYCVHSIVLCCPSLVSARLCVALLMPALTIFERLSSHQHHVTTATPWRCESRFFSILGNNVVLSSLCLLSGAFFPCFFRCLIKLATTHSTG